MRKHGVQEWGISSEAARAPHSGGVQGDDQGFQSAGMQFPPCVSVSQRQSQRLRLSFVAMMHRKTGGGWELQRLRSST